MEPPRNAEELLPIGLLCSVTRQLINIIMDRHHITQAST